MTILQYILVFFAVVIMVLGLFMVLRGIRNRQKVHMAKALARDKDGIPILPRHERNLIVEEPEPIEEDSNHREATQQQQYAGEQEAVSTTNVQGTPQYQHANQQAQNIHSQQPVQTQQYAHEAAHDESRAFVEEEQQQHYNHNNANYQANNPNNHSHQNSQQENTAGDKDDLFSTLASATENLMPPVDVADAPGFNENSPVLDEHLLAAADQDQNSPLNHAEENINITLTPHHHFETIHGTTVLSLVDQYGLKYGAMNMFHRYENKDGTGILWFSMMGLTDDGIAPFDLNSLPQSKFKGLVLFLSLPHPKAMQGFDSMMSIVGLIAKQLNVQVLDEDNEPLTRERKQQLRHQVQEHYHARQ